MKRIVLTMTAAVMLVTSMATGVQAASHKGDSLCTINPSTAAVGQSYVVSAAGLPALSPINLFVTDPNGDTTGAPLGSTPDGTFNLAESAGSPGTWSYAFTGPVKNNTMVYARCSIQVS